MSAFHRIVYGEGSLDSRVMVVGERPGVDEAKQGRPFVGRAGDELWDRLYQFAGLERRDTYTTNTVLSFSLDPPNQTETDEWAGTLYDDVKAVKPELILTVGAFALRWFFEVDASIDKMHGLVLRSPRWPGIDFIPLYHSSAALRQPERYQEPFTRDCRAVGRYLDGHKTIHRATRPTIAIYDLRNASTDIVTQARSSIVGGMVGVDLEGSIERPECVTFGDKYAAWLVQCPPRESQWLAGEFVDGITLALMHNAVRDLRALDVMGLVPRRFHDSMLGAFLLGEAQALKTLAFRHCGLVMDDYMDLVSPVDEALCRKELSNAYTTHRFDGYRRAALKHAADRWGVRLRRLVDARSPGPDRHATLVDVADRVRARLDRAVSDTARSVGRPLWTGRVVSALRRLLDTEDAEDSLRRRWSRSVSAPLVPLPPEPTWQSLDAKVSVPYACVDAHAHHQVWTTHVEPELKRQRLWDCYLMDRSVLPFLARMETVGMTVDVKQLRHLSAELDLNYVRVCAKIEAILGYPLNPKASEDVSETLFDELGVTPTKLTKSGAYFTTQDKYLEARKHEHEVIPLIIQGRELAKLKSSYTDKLPTMLDALNVYHADFGYTRAASGRLVETIILLIPKHTVHVIDGKKVKWGKLIRTAFVARPNCSLVSCDLSQIELRVLAHESRDRKLIEIFEKGRDPHAEFAHDILGAPKRKEDQDESRHRLPAKKGNFGAFMGLSPGGLTEQIRAGGNPAWAQGCRACDFTGSDIRDRPDHDAGCDSRQFFRAYWTRHPGIRSYIDQKHDEARRRGFVRDMWGRKIYVAGIWSSSRQVVGRAERMAQATPIQAGADGLSKHWNAKIWSALLNKGRGTSRYCEPWTRTHDDTVLEVDTRDAKSVKTAMLKLVPQALCVPALADGKVGFSWGKLE